MNDYPMKYDPGLTELAKILGCDVDGDAITVYDQIRREFKSIYFNAKAGIVHEGNDFGDLYEQSAGKEKV